MKTKTVKESRTVKTTLILPPDANNHGTIFGGKVMSYIDEVAAVVAMKHSRSPVVTVSIDSVDFLAPAKIGYSICLEAFMTSVGRTSMEVFVKVTSEDLLTGHLELTATSFVTFVALDERGRPTEVPKLVPETEEEINLFKTAPERQKMRKERKKNSQQFIQQLGIKIT